MESNTSPGPAQTTATAPFFHGNLKTLGFSRQILIIGLLLAVAAGGLTGYLLNGKGLGATGNSNNSSGAAGEATSVKSAGINDKTAFPDCAQGQLEKGGLKDEGTHHLVRGGGPNQTAYLISSVVDLEAFSGKMVELCGKSIASKKAPWLMDVGYIATIE